MSETRAPHPGEPTTAELRSLAALKCLEYENHPASPDQTTGVLACSAILGLLGDRATGYTRANAMRDVYRAADRLVELHAEVSRLTAECERLQLAEREKWAIAPQCNGGWVINETNDRDMSGDAPEGRELARTRGPLSEALAMAAAALAATDTQEPT